MTTDNDLIAKVADYRAKTKSGQVGITGAKELISLVRKHYGYNKIHKRDMAIRADEKQRCIDAALAAVPDLGEEPDQEKYPVEWALWWDRRRIRKEIKAIKEGKE